MKPREYDLRLRESFTLGGFMLTLGFIGVSAAYLEDNWWAGVSLAATVCFVGLLNYLLVHHADRGWRDYVLIVAFAAALAALMYGITDRFWISLGIVAGWTISSCWFQAGNRAYALEDAVNELRRSGEAPGSRRDRQTGGHG